MIKKFSKYIASVLIFAAICAAAYWVSPKQLAPDAGRWYSIIPPVVAIILAFLTHRVLFSLGMALVVGGLLPPAESVVKLFFPNLPAVLGWPARSISFVVTSFLNTGNIKQTIDGEKSFEFFSLFNHETFWMLSFVIIIFVMIEILIMSGGFNGVIKLMTRYIKGRKSAQFITALLGVLFFIDDYANSMIIGSSMRPLTDRFGVSREKLSFLVDATSAPVTGLAVISTWIAYEVGLFNQVSNQLGLNKSGYSMFFDALQFRFYCTLMILFLFIHIFMSVDFGPMRIAEEREKRKDLWNRDFNNNNNKEKPAASAEDYFRLGRPVSAILPIIGLVMFHIFLLWYTGGGVEKYENIKSLINFSYWQSTISEVKDTSKLLIFSSSFGLLLAAICALFIEKLPLRKFRHAAVAGIKHCFLPMAILVLAWSLKNCCDSLKTGQFLASVLQGNVSPFLFPPLLFLVASITSFATGTSWGTMAILIPTGIPVAYALDGNQYGITTMISLAAVLDGAIFGDHCSPVSDTTILSSIASRCNHMDHVRTQLPYSLFTAAIAMMVGYLPAAMGLNWIETIVIATILIIILLALIKRFQKPLPENLLT